jgi:hypothetical protein
MIDGITWPIYLARKLALALVELDNAPTVPLGERIAQVAAGQLGRGEQGGNNAGHDVAQYKGLLHWTPGGDQGAWCASFASWCLVQAGVDPTDLGVEMATWTRRRHGARWLWRTVGRAGGHPTTPEPGDLCLWDRGPAGSWQAHVGIVSASGWPERVEGNHGPTVRLYLDTRPRFLGFARVPM